MHSRKLAVLGAAALLAVSPLGVSAFAAEIGAPTLMAAGAGPNGSGSSEAETQGSAQGKMSGEHAPRVGSPGPTGSGSSEAETQGAGPQTSVNPTQPHNSGGVITHQGGAVGSSGASH